MRSSRVREEDVVFLYRLLIHLECGERTSKAVLRVTCGVAARYAMAEMK